MSLVTACCLLSLQAQEQDDTAAMRACLFAAVKQAGGRLAGHQLSTVYQRCPGAQAIVRLAGGLHNFCLKHCEGLEFIQNDGAGIVQLKRAAGGSLKVKLCFCYFDLLLPDHSLSPWNREGNVRHRECGTWKVVEAFIWL